VIDFTEDGGEGVYELEVSDQPLASGSYRESDFQPPVTFSVEGEWYAVQGAAGFFDIQRDVGSPDVIAVQFANVDEVAGADGSGVPVSSAAEAAEALEANSDLTVLGSDRSRMAGREGYVVDVENGSRATQQVVRVPAGNIAIDPGRRLWVAFFDTSNGVMAIMVGGSSERWEEALAAAEPILETVVIED
jgi:hypothetical protein